MTSAYLIAAARTPQGRLLGALSHLSAPQLAARAIASVMESSGLSQVDQVILGHVVAAGVGQAPARQAATFARLSETVGAVSINKVCGSGLYSVMLADMAIRAGEYQAVIAGGMESMSRAPYLLPNLRVGNKYGSIPMIDALDSEGLVCAQLARSMGSIAEQLAQRLRIDRQSQDKWAMQSHQRAVTAQQSGRFVNEIVAIESVRGKETCLCTEDESPRGNASLETLGRLAPVFATPAEGGSVTAGNSSSLADGAAAVAVVGEQMLKELTVPWAFRLVGHVTCAGPHIDIFTAPVRAVNELLRKTGRSIHDIDLVEINEAFAVQTLACIQQLQVDESKVNVHGGAIALGHPLGASGTRILVTLIHALLSREQSRGIATLCLGGGEAVALMIERVQ